MNSTAVVVHVCYRKKFKGGLSHTTRGSGKIPYFAPLTVEIIYDYERMLKHEVGDNSTIQFYYITYACTYVSMYVCMDGWMYVHMYAHA